MKKLLVLTAAIAASMTARVSAADNLDMKYFTVDDKFTVIEEVKGGTLPGDPPTGPIINGHGGGNNHNTPTIPSPGDLPKPPSGPVSGNDVPNTNNTNNPAPNGNGGINFDNINGTIGVIDNIVNLMDKIMTLIAKNQPVVNITVNYANAVPYGTSHWTQLQGWSKPSTKKYAFVMKNLYGAEVVKVIYQVHWTHSGNFQGKGKFLTGVAIEPLSVTTAWGYNVDLTAEVPDSTIANVGTSADPIASMQVQLKWKVHTIVKDIQEKAIYYVQGDGKMEPIGNAYSNGISINNQKSIDALNQRLANVKFN